MQIVPRGRRKAQNEIERGYFSWQGSETCVRGIKEGMPEEC